MSSVSSVASRLSSLSLSSIRSSVAICSTSLPISVFSVDRDNRAAAAGSIRGIRRFQIRSLMSLRIVGRGADPSPSP